MAALRTRTLALIMAALVGTLAVPVVLAVNSGGGTVSNSAPTVDSFTSAAGAAQSKDTSDILSGTVRDKNGEARIAQVSIQFVSGPLGASTLNHNVDAADRAATTEGAAVVDVNGITVWNPGGTADGVLAFSFQYTWTDNGVYVIRAHVDDQTNLNQAGSPDLTITITDGFTLSDDPVNAAGAAQVAASWGSWAAIPGATSVASLNYLEIHNSGNNPSQAFTLDFTPAIWTGTDGATFAIDENIVFACAESATAVAPSTLTFTPEASSLSGSIDHTFGGLDRYAYCTYTIEAIPDPLLDQAYNAAFTAS
jgi:hypothetical protein